MPKDNKMAQLLFEIGAEELPALAIEPAMEYMASYMSAALAKANLSFSGLKTFGTPRRLVLMIDDLAKTQPDLEEELLGPSVAIAYNKDGTLSPAALGFIKAKGLSESQVYKTMSAKGEVIAAKMMHKGKATAEILPPLLLDLIRSIPFKKRMRWESSGESFARPIRSLLALFDAKPLSITYADVQSGPSSFGHRFMAPETFVVKSNEQYLLELKKRFVMPDPKERERKFLEEVEVRLKPHHASMRKDSELMATVRNLFEYPFVVLGSFPKKYLEIPEEILVCEMTTHQKCFAVNDEKAKLMPFFVGNAGLKPYDEAVFAEGNARVIKARFEDGAFYFAQDRKKTLAEHAVALKNVVFERELGTMAEKAARIEKTALAMASALGLDNEQSLIKKAAPLLKADLVTGVVGQFPELQGVMGRIYASLEGQNPEICEAIETHYWPRFAEDQLPRLKGVALLALADRLDTMVGIIAIGKGPKGNKDPFALRRAAIAVVRLLVHFGFSVDIKELVLLALRSYGDRFKDKSQAISLEVADFIVQRARGLLIEELSKESPSLAVSFTDSILAVGSQDIVDAFLRAQALISMHDQNPSDFLSLTQTFKRAGNIVKKSLDAGEELKLEEALLTSLKEPCERELLASVQKTKAIFAKSDFADYKNLLSEVAMIKPKLDAFFDGVMVMVEDPKLRQARLGLLLEIKTIADKIADFTHL
jgi:glycyl-tRNA synthetase beta chain